MDDKAQVPWVTVSQSSAMKHKSPRQGFQHLGYLVRSQKIHEVEVVGILGAYLLYVFFLGNDFMVRRQ